VGCSSCARGRSELKPARLDHRLKTAMDNDDCEFEHSPLSGSFTRDGETIEVEIFRLAGAQDRWHMEIVHFSGCTRWQDTFATDAEAHAILIAMIEASGLVPFVDRRPMTQH